MLVCCIGAGKPEEMSLPLCIRNGLELREMYVSFGKKTQYIGTHRLILKELSAIPTNWDGSGVDPAWRTKRLSQGAGRSPLLAPEADLTGEGCTPLD